MTSGTDNKRFKHGRRPLSRRGLLLGLLMLVVVGIAYLVHVAHYHLNTVIRDSYAQWWVADLIIEHLERNDGSWPNDWNSLREPYEICAGRSGRPWTFEELRERVDVDFTADPSELAKQRTNSGEPSFRVISLRSGKQHHWEGREPNALILDYFNERSERPATYKYPKRPHPAEKQSRAELLTLGVQWALDVNGRITRVNMASANGSPRYSDSVMVHS